MKIDIDTDDIYAFYDIASLVDQDSFLEEIKKLREKYKQIIPKDDTKLQYLPKKHTQRMSDINREIRKLRRNDNNISTEQLNRAYSELNNQRIKIAKLYSPSEDYRLSIVEQVERYSKPPYFELVVKAAIEKNAVTDKDYIRGIVIPKHLYDQLNLPDFAWQNQKATEMVITIYPNTTPKEMDRLFWEAKGYLEKEELVVPKKVKNKIRLHRDIYWFWKENYLDKKITDWEKPLREWQEKCPIYIDATTDHPKGEYCPVCENKKIDKRTFKDAVEEYINWLTRFAS